MTSRDRFLTLYKIIKDKYYSPDGAPYHSLEEEIVEAPDWGHTSTSEAYSYSIMLEVYKQMLDGKSELETAWNRLEQQIIPTQALQPSNNFYNADKPAGYAAEYQVPDGYPSQISLDVPVGKDPLAAELAFTYGTKNIYGMHWLLDVDNDYKYGNMSDGVSKPSYINTFQRGEQESVW